MKSKILFSSKTFIAALLVLLAFLGSTKYKQYQQAKKVDAEKQKILAQISAFQKKNEEIANSLEYFKSEGFKQRMAREQLNLKQPDEKVYSFRQAENTPEQPTLTVEQKLSNPQKWLKYFVGELYSDAK